MRKVRLNKYLARSGVTSRRKSDLLIEQGKVRVNGQVVTRLGTKIDPATDKVDVHGKQVSPEAKHYLVLHKPPGYLVTMDDPFDRPTIKELIPDLKVRLFPVGRLDFNSEGLLLMTNDGELAHQLMHPRFHRKKIYMVWIRGQIKTQDMDRLFKGVFLDGKKTSLDKIDLIKKEKDSSLLKVEIHEGRKREIRRMFQAVGSEVWRLKRIQFAGLRLRGLKKGQWRYLTPEEIKILRNP
ncbi:MAG: pseudouridine synthase [Candidatus Aminicenantes bacterium]|nr:pseudouridine synthase [Candidatus Aminicenantes bacterium]